MKSNLNMFIYDNKDDLNDFTLSKEQKDCDLILLHQTRVTSDLVKQLNLLSKGVANPKEIDSDYPNSFLAQLRNSNRPIGISSPLTDNPAHSPYFNTLDRIDDLEVKISQNFLDGEHYSNFSMFDRIFDLYQYSFQYFFTYLREQILQRAFLQNIGAWEQSGQDKINVLVIGNHNFASLRIAFNQDSDIQISHHTVKNQHVTFSIRHEIMRRKLLQLNIPEQLYNGFTIERSIRLLENEITIPSKRSENYSTRSSLCHLTDEQTINLSTEIASKPTAIHKLNHLAEL